MPEARSFLRHVLSEWDIIDRFDDAVLCLSELATNAIRHGVPQGGYFLVKASLIDGRLRIEVHDQSGLLPRVKCPEADDVSGRGLLLVDALADGWGVEPRVPCGKTVWTEFKIEIRQEPAAGVIPC
ncbi:ATP-binding protein [Streptomyces sp. A3M-1-3]|uniref:ATP-binding protein n=1 Tax=Streptomyces sp. A3M-1-3 TaxID=2962044 RepID=UPI0020B64410|nr:ATP-binding protein [Streptomyces sp. A3M-1-3]MCP3821901.1 ATP-binding protein [Streptomyces sp. A3M-1-3]